MFPNTKHAPTFFPQNFNRLSISSLVAGNLLTPILGICAWHSAVPAAAMPKTSINEDCKSLARENEIWIPRQRRMSPPTFDSTLTEQVAELCFGRLVPSRTNRSHDL